MVRCLVSVARISAAVALVLMTSLALGPSDALADRFRGGGSRPTIKSYGGPRGAPGSMGAFRRHGLAPRHGFNRPFHKPFFRPFIPTVIYTTPYSYFGYPGYYAGGSYSPPAYYEGSSTYNVFYPPQAGFSPPASYMPPPPATPRVVEFPTGRYELEGDGVSTPYVWVWVPNPPASPPPPAPPSGVAKPQSDPVPERAPSTLYRWTDSDGVTHWTNRPAAVPSQYRPGAKQAGSS
jgi:hypothetical protein